MNLSRGGHGKGRVLVVDDYEDSAEIVCALLETLGYEAHPGHCGRDALGLAGELAPDIVILDILLIDMSGYEVARALRARPDGHSLHLIALTGFGGPANRAQALEAGFNQHVVKPLELAALRRMLARTQGPAESWVTRS